MREEIKLKRCPFCGSMGMYYHNEITNRHIARCNNCMIGFNEETRQKVEDCWNNRPEEDRLREIIRKKDEALEYYAKRNNLDFETKEQSK